MTKAKSPSKLECDNDECGERLGVSPPCAIRICGICRVTHLERNPQVPGYLQHSAKQPHISCFVGFTEVLVPIQLSHVDEGITLRAALHGAVECAGISRCFPTHIAHHVKFLRLCADVPAFVLTLFKTVYQFLGNATWIGALSRPRWRIKRS